VRLTGTIALDAARQVRTVAVANPTQYFVNAARAGLQANGIEVRGAALDIDDLAEDLGTWDGEVLLTHRSPLLSSLGDTLMKLSQNMFAETLLRTIGKRRSGSGTAEAGRTAIREVLTSWGVPASEVLMADGSGLSRYNLVTADALVSVLAHVYDEPRLRDAYLNTLPIAGRAGTLAARMKGTVAEGNVQAKTGSFTNARSVAGFVRTADNEPVVFSILANNYGVSPEAVDRVTDAIIVSLAEFRR
jgi:D-alanyl-D-alanine carboxypeptidase/D-alanyl-D-alanine-endopeptidase (penicillin-binding protein 4)